MYGANPSASRHCRSGVAHEWKATSLILKTNKNCVSREDPDRGDPALSGADGGGPVG